LLVGAAGFRLRAMNPKPAQTLLWLQAASCGGCTMSALGAEPEGLAEALRRAGIELLWHPSLSEESGAQALEILEDCRDGRRRLDILCVEGAVLRGPSGSGRFQILSGTGQPMARWVEELAGQAGTVLAVGSCSAYGAMPSANPLVEAVGLQFTGDDKGGLLPESFRSKTGLPVINIAGCAPHPGWLLESLMALTQGLLQAGGLDSLGRPRFWANHLAHHGCARNEYYEFKASAAQHSQLGCLMENLGCKATQAPGDCNIRVWNGSSGGWTPGAALGAKLAAPDRDVIAVCGDGFYMFGTPAPALWAAKHHNAPFMVVVYQNRSYTTGTLAVDRKYPDSYAAKAGYPGGYFDPPIDFAKEAEAAGAYGENVRDPAEIGPALQRGLKQIRSGTPAVISVWLPRLGQKD